MKFMENGEKCRNERESGLHIKLAITLFIAGIVIFAAGLLYFEKYSPLNPGVAVTWQFILGVIGVTVGLGVLLAGSVQWLIATILRHFAK
jgi:hypothetical protein